MTTRVKLLWRPVAAESVEKIERELLNRRITVESLAGTGHRPGETLQQYLARVMKHGVVEMEGHMWEYNETGVHSLFHDDHSEHFEQVSEAQTEVTVAGLMTWLMQPSNRGRFSKDSYNPGTNNCIHFVRAVCGFLNVEFPAQLDDILAFCQRMVELNLAYLLIDAASAVGTSLLLLNSSYGLGRAASSLWAPLGAATASAVTPLTDAAITAFAPVGTALAPVGSALGTLTSYFRPT